MSLETQTGRHKMTYTDRHTQIYAQTDNNCSYRQRDRQR